MRLGVRRHARRVTLLTCRDPLSDTSLQEIAHHLAQAGQARGRVVVIDVSAVTRIDNETLCRLCVTLHGLNGARVRITGSDRRVRRVLSLCTIDGLELGPSLEPRLLQRLLECIWSLRLRWQGALARQLDVNRLPSRPLS